MRGLRFRKAALALVFIAGIGSIVATSAPPPPYHFRDVNIEPLWRCPGGDVEITWELARFAPVRVMVDGKEFETSTASGATLPADLLDGGAPVAALELHIEAEDADYPREYEITTFGGERMVEELAFHTRGGVFRIDRRGVWDERIRVVGVKVVQVRNLVCEGNSTTPLAWEVTPPSGPSFLLRAEAGYSGSPDLAPPPGGWKLRHRGGNCRLPKSGLEPYLEVTLTAVCVGVNSAS